LSYLAKSLNVVGLNLPGARTN